MDVIPYNLVKKNIPNIPPVTRTKTSSFSPMTHPNINGKKNVGLTKEYLRFVKEGLPPLSYGSHNGN